MEMIALLVGDRLTVGQMPPVEIIGPYPTPVRYCASEKVAGFLDRSKPVGCVTSHFNAGLALLHGATFPIGTGDEDDARERKEIP